MAGALFRKVCTFIGAPISVCYLGVALATMVLTGSLLVGDAVKETLRHQAELRIGKADEAMIAGDHFFREGLADATDAAPAILVRGSVTRPDAAARVNSAQVVAVDSRFWTSPRPVVNGTSPPANSA